MSDIEPSSREDGEAKKALITKELSETENHLSAFETKLRQSNAETADEQSDSGDEGTNVPSSKLAAWEGRKKKYLKYAEDGNVKKLEKVIEKQKAKAKKAETKAADKPYYQDYLQYKRAKVEYTEKLMKLARLVQNMKKAGFVR